MDNDLNRSLRMLEESLASPGTTKFKERNKNRYADLSLTLLPHEYQHLMERDESLANTKILLTGSSKPKEKNRSKLVDLSITLAPHEVRYLMDGDTHTAYTSPFSTYLEGDKTIAGSILRANEPWKSTANSLYNEFYETLQAHSDGHEVFEIISDLARCCSDALQVIQGLKTKVSKEDDAEYAWLENEKNTWRLLFVLYQDRLSTLNLNKDEQIGGLYFGTSEKLCVSHLFKTDNLLRESQLVIDWLEYSAAERDNETLHFADMTVGWENTLHQLQSAETIVFESSRKIVSSLHPDAPHHEKLPLHDLDMEDEARLCRRMFQEIRCGKLEQAKALCVNCGHAWRAALLEGWRLFHNPNLSYDIVLDECMDTDSVDKETSVREIMKEEDLQVTEGNANRDIWKKMAYLYCQKPYLNVYEKAAVAAYCGHLHALLAVSNNWEDNLWAYMRVLVDIRVESEIRDSIDKLYQQLPEEYWDQKMSLNKVFSCLEASENSTVRTEAKMQDYIIQKYVILDEIPKLMEALNEWVEDPTTSSQFLRFVAHLVLFLELIGQSGQKDVTEKVVQA
ncbi:hypothetical protein ILUMI_05870 [Ignelater luminosus]|uniref:Nuclear pore complex protein n=1 Tax=Ignelater luminosus TaxID=2038154 RepID=A0A8K0GIA2_IGNLU|nr:hypothetical protein ILUMI_05870 [Ignelater luminosus]